LFEKVYDAYFEILYNRQISLEHKFLSLVRALEIYYDFNSKMHNLGNSYALSEDRWNSVKNEIINLIFNMLSEKEANILMRNLDCLNRFPLEEKLGYILNNCLGQYLKELNEFIDDFITNENDFIEKIVMIKDRLSNSTNEYISKGKFIKSSELRNIVLNLKRLLEICILRDLNFSFETIKEIYSKRSIKDLKRQLEEMWLLF